MPDMTQPDPPVQAMSDERLAEIEARLKAATPGPWEWHENGGRDMGRFDGAEGRSVCTFGDSSDYYPTQGEPPETWDRDLIAHAPTDLASLIATVRSLRTALARAAAIEAVNAAECVFVIEDEDGFDDMTDAQIERAYGARMVAVAHKVWAAREALRASTDASPSTGVVVPIGHLKEAMRFYPKFDHDVRTRLIRDDLLALLSAAGPGER
jgi:hypothetical protein